MKKINFNKRYFLRRVIALPFVFGIILIAHLAFVFNRTWHYFLYGGEWVNFEKNERDSMLAIFEMLKELNAKTEHHE